MLVNTDVLRQFRLGIPRERKRVLSRLKEAWPPERIGEAVLAAATLLTLGAVLLSLHQGLQNYVITPTLPL